MKNDRRKATAAIITAAALSAAMVTSDNRKEEEKKTCTQIKRERRTVEQIYRSLGQDIPNRSFRHPKTSSVLPRTILHQMVIDSHKTRPQLNV